jgi:hypothetical protein
MDAKQRRIAAQERLKNAESRLNQAKNRYMWQANHGTTAGFHEASRHLEAATTIYHLAEEEVLAATRRLPR